jgi:hypothetical protein
VRAALLLSFLLACGDNVPASITIESPAAWQPAIGEFIALTPYKDLAIGDDGAMRIQLVEDASLGDEAFDLSLIGETLTVRAKDGLGAQYGAAAALEALGFRFRHPFDTYVPSPPKLDPALVTGMHAPETRVRGLQLHTLHPIEGYFAFWEPSPGSTNDAHRIIDWLVKNRGNFLQWVALDDILDPSRGEPWKAFTQELIEYAHARGVRTGLNIQLFGQSNLQNAFDLVDADPANNPVAEQIAARLPIVTKDLAFDVYDLSFGEFFNADPAVFISSVNEVKNALAALAPNAEMHAVVHVGAEQIVNFMGEDLLYYFLIKFADPGIIHDVHTTMFYNLFETTSGAYHHNDFSEHRAYLFDQQCRGRRPAYFPETAYWVAFDNSVPQYMPLYVHNRWLDLSKLRSESPCPEIPLDNHLLFSSGWEWGYWLHDVTALRASYELPAQSRELVEHAFGTDLAPAVEPVVALIELQREQLHLKDLMAYIASRDVAIDAGRALDIVSQPDRITFADMVANAYAPAELDTVLAGLTTYANALDLIAKQLRGVPGGRWGDELRDGFEIDQLRVRFVIATYEAMRAHLAGDATTAKARASTAEELLDEARGLVARRHGDMHDTHNRRLVDKAGETNANRTYYQYGYLYNADTLCFWRRELIQVNGYLGNTSTVPPGCLFP